MSGVTKRKPERWANVGGSGGDYEVTTWGRVKSYRGKKPVFLHPSVRKGNGKVLTLRLGGRIISLTVGKLVALTFIPNPKNRSRFIRLDKDISNDYAGNLRWATDKESMNHYKVHEGSAKKKSVAVNQLTLSGILVKKWDSMSDPQREGFLTTDISCCCRKKTSYLTHHGFKWEYA